MLQWHSVGRPVLMGIGSNMLVLAGGKVIDGTGRGPLDGASIVVDGGRIVAVGSNVSYPTGTRVVDLRSFTACPRCCRHRNMQWQFTFDLLAFHLEVRPIAAFVAREDRRCFCQINNRAATH